MDLIGVLILTHYQRRWCRLNFFDFLTPLTSKKNLLNFLKKSSSKNSNF